MTEPAGGDRLTQEDVGRDAAVLRDRRRPGRRSVDPSLIVLLRDQEVTPGQADLLDGETGHAAIRPRRDDLSGVVGLARGLGIAGLVWLVVAAVIAF